MGAQILLGQSMDFDVAIKGQSDAPMPSTSAPTLQKREKTIADKEYKHLQRLLRNRALAQQARGRKKSCLNNLENRARDLQQRNSELEERISTLQNENFMLRKILEYTTRSKESGNLEVRLISKAFSAITRRVPPVKIGFGYFL